MADNIEDADVVVDLSGGRLLVQRFRERIKQLQAENDRLKKLLEGSSVVIFQKGFEEGQKTAVESCKQVVNDELSKAKKALKKGE